MTERSRPIKVLLGKPGLDGHDQGAKVVVRALRDAGFEVIYTGLRQTPEAITRIALQEDVDVIGVSSLATDHVLVPKLVQALRDAGLAHVAVVVGGIVPDPDVEMLAAAGVARVFHPGATRDEIVDAIASLAAGARAAAEE